MGWCNVTSFDCKTLRAAGAGCAGKSWGVAGGAGAHDNGDGCAVRGAGVCGCGGAVCGWEGRVGGCGRRASMAGLLVSRTRRVRVCLTNTGQSALEDGWRATLEVGDAEGVDGVCARV